MKKSHKGLIILLTPFVLGFLLGIMVGRCSGPRPEKPAEEITEIVVTEPEVIDKDDVDGTGVTEVRQVIYYAPRMSYAKQFADLNPEHLDVAAKVGLRVAPKTRDNIDPKSGLVRLEDNQYYVVDELRYSVPYLTKGAAAELMTISKAFADSLKSKDLVTDYRLVVSSVLRTEEDVNRLRRSGNPNASENSAHCYGTTFDITYTRYFREDEESDVEMQPYELTKVLAEVLRDERNAGHCLVKYERKEHCFHITSTR